MTVKEYLSQAKATKLRLETLSEQIAYLKSAAEYCGVIYSDISRAAQPNVHKTEDTIIRLVDWEEKLAGQFAKLDEINKTLDTLTDPIQHNVIVKHYLYGKTWRQIANELNYSERSVHYIHNTALKELEKTLQTFADNCSLFHLA
jgi:RNA polymerase sigma factor (sigma-70 family)